MMLHRYRTVDGFEFDCDVALQAGEQGWIHDPVLLRMTPKLVIAVDSLSQDRPERIHSHIWHLMDRGDGVYIYIGDQWFEERGDRLRASVFFPVCQDVVLTEEPSHLKIDLFANGHQSDWLDWRDDAGLGGSFPWMQANRPELMARWQRTTKAFKQESSQVKGGE